MAFRLVSSGGNVTDPAVVNMRCSGTIWPGSVVEFSRTAGEGVTPASYTSTVTNIFGVALNYTQGVGDSYSARVIPFAQGQIWEADCANVVGTAQIGLRTGLNPGTGVSGTDRGRSIYNIATDSTAATAIFRIIALASGSTGSGKVLGYFRRGDDSGVGYGVSITTGY